MNSFIFKAMEEMSDEQLAGLEGVTSDFAAPLLYSMQLALKNQTIDKKVNQVSLLISRQLALFYAVSC